VTSPKARASIIWVVGEYVDVIAQYAPDILRQLAKGTRRHLFLLLFGFNLVVDFSGFATEPDVVKMQIINLAVKLLLTNPEQTHALAHYVFFMAKFDTNYDIRDKARAIRFLLPPQQSVCCLYIHPIYLFVG
jgi:AP-3 complex subunit beta